MTPGESSKVGEGAHELPLPAMATSLVELVDGGGISSSNCRELDDALLPNQTRIWLGEVLNMCISQDKNLSDLLADGQILFGVYKVFREKFPETESVSSTQIPENCSYPKVERFLKFCKSFGVGEDDLFAISDVLNTTSDAVNKTNTVKVCKCLRALSNEARLKDPNNLLQIPEFDSVITNLENASGSFIRSPVNNSDDDCGGTYELVHDQSINEHGNNLEEESDGSSVRKEETFGSSEIEHLDRTGDVEAIDSSLPVAVESAETVQHTVNQSSNSGCENGLPDKVTSAGSSVGTDDMEAIESPLLVAVGSAENVQHRSNRCSDCREINNHSNSGCENTEIDLPDESQIAEDESKNIARECKLPWTMLKLIAGGTAVGFMLYFLQQRKKRKENAAPQKIFVSNSTKIAAIEKPETASTNKIYPGCKLRF